MLQENIWEHAAQVPEERSEPSLHALGNHWPPPKARMPVKCEGQGEGGTGVGRGRNGVVKLQKELMWWTCVTHCGNPFHSDRLTELSGLVLVHLALLNTDHLFLERMHH